MRTSTSWIRTVVCGLALSSAPVLAQDSPPKPRQPQQAMPAGEAPRQLSEQSQKALARLDALNDTRAKYAQAAADVAEESKVKEFLRQRAREYQQASMRLEAFAQTYGVDMDAPQMRKLEQKTTQQWQRENQKIEKAQGSEAAKLALSTFIERNEDAIKDLRTLRGDVQEESLRELINERIASLEEESTRAQQLRRELQMEQQQQRQQQQQQQQQPSK